MTTLLRLAPVLALLAAISVLVTLLAGEERRVRQAGNRTRPKGIPMSDPVYVVQVQTTGRWFSECLDTRCGYFPHEVAESSVKSRVEAAATRHRKLLRTLPAEDFTPRSDTCPTCCQSTKAITALQDLVRELEAKLANFETEAA
ncbi:hypothetical protein OG786_29170 [Streptomyces sp. NBC_00101]|uniref:hypothetical protein n=1 Tax=Streptomyces sp. NBC_00101 TaxID=2975651 RepID=UPI00324EABDD